MVKIAVSLLLGVGVGASVAHWQGSGGEQVFSGLSVEDHSQYVSRLNELETSLALERFQRQALAEELASLRHTMAALPAHILSLDDESQSLPREPLATTFLDDTNGPVTERVRDSSSVGVPRTADELEMHLRQQRVDRFVAAGIAPQRAFAIMQREETLEMGTLRARHAATRSGATAEEVANITPLALLRSELGDTDYANYLDARGRPTSIIVRNVARSSPAEIAGLMPDDEIITYNGQRVFDVNELAGLTQEADAGNLVPLEVIRDGQSMRVYVEAGPIGINSDGRSSGI